MNSYIAGNYKTLSNTISQVVPAVILENTNFEDLFSAYYKFTEQSGQFYKESKILFDSFNYSKLIEVEIDYIIPNCSANINIVRNSILELH